VSDSESDFVPREVRGIGQHKRKSQERKLKLDSETEYLLALVPLARKKAKHASNKGEISACLASIDLIMK
jgi:hypothetical protein